MPPNNAQSPFQANTLPPPRRDRDTLETAFANLSIRPFARSAIPQPFNHIVTASGQTVIIAASNHVHTSSYTLGDNTRSYLEGMVPVSGTDRTGSPRNTGVPRSLRNIGTGGPRSSRNIGTGGSRSSRIIGTGGPRSLRNIVTGGPRISGPIDTSGSRNSTAIATQAGTARGTIFQSAHDVQMASRQQHIESMAPTERGTQESWAQTMIQRTASCPQQYSWSRIGGGYQCKGGHHYISDQLLAEGNGGVMLLINPSQIDPNYGPYYPDPNRKGNFLYSGIEPRPRHAPEFINEMGNHNSSGASKLRGSLIRSITRGT